MAPTAALTEMGLDELAALVSRADQARTREREPQAPGAEGDPPLSYAQERLVFMDRLSEGHPFYNLAYGVTITGDLDVHALRCAWLDVVARHETLRSFFPDDDDGNPCVRFLPAEDCAIRHDDLRALGTAERAARLDQEIHDMVAAPYHLRTGPLARGVVLQAGPDQFTFLYGFHHSVFDGWSQDIFHRELFQAYAARLRGAAPDLPPLPMTHGQYARRQRETMEGAYGTAEGSWWREHLAEVDDLRLVTDKPRPGAQSFEGASVTFTIPRPVSVALEELARRSGASPFMLWVALFAIMLGKYSGQRRFAIGSSLAGRTLPGTESLLGFLVNNLVIRIDNDPGQTFEEHLRSVQESVLASYAHGEYPFQLVAQSLGRHPDLSRNPVYQATFTYQNYQESPKNVAGLSFSEVSFPVLSTHVDLDIVAWPTEEGVVCCMLYATDLFLHETAQAFGDAMVALARYVAAAPDALLADILKLDVLPNLSRRPPSVLAGEAASYPFRSPWERLMDHVERTPDAPALIVGGEGPERDVSVSFSRLAAMSSRLAETLDGHGVGPGKTTVILAYTGVELFVAMFAVWHRNGSWLLVDPDIPGGRMAAILAEVAPDSILAMPGIPGLGGPENVTALPGALHMLPVWTQLPPGRGALAPVQSREEDIAMLFCTSGSTGHPKVAPCTHDAVSRRLAWEMAEFPLGQGDLGCLKSSVSYADFFYEAFVPVLSGAPLLLLGHSPAFDVQKMMQQMERHGVTKMVAVPSLLKAMHRIGQGLKGRLQSLRFIRTSGEPMPTQLAEAVVEALPGVTFYSVYGALEMHNPTGFCYSREHYQAGCDTRYLPAGVPLPGRAVALLDEYRMPVPWGETGELYAGGWGLTPGYLSGEGGELFPVLDILEPGARWYQSGDVGYLDERGRLHITGRKDFQIKVRGVRIEPDDVEGLMLGFPGVAEARIAAWEDGEDGQRLHGFVTLAPSAACSDTASFAGTLRSFLQENLPAVMVPDSITVLEDWPRTATGKTHLARLKEAFKRTQAMADRSETGRFRGPEAVIARIWGKVLRGGHFRDAKASFFAAGGNSLILISLHHELQKEFRREFPLTVLFQNPTIESQARFFAQAAAPGEDAVPLGAPRGRGALQARRRPGRP